MSEDINININERELINMFGEVYNIAKEVFEVEPIEASPKEQKKIRKWICKNSPLYETFPFIDKSTSDESVIDLVYSFNQSLKDKSDDNVRFFSSVKDCLDEDVISVFNSLIDYSYVHSKLEQSNNTIKIPVDNCAAFSRVLTLIDCVSIDFGEYHCIDFSGSTFSKNEEHYIITALLENFETDTSTPIVFKFKNAKVEIISYNATETSTWHFGTPWEMLFCIASEILEKSKINYDSINKKEQDLLPLLEEIDFFGFYKDYKKKNFPLIKELATKFNLTELVKLFEELEQLIAEGKGTFKTISKIHQELEKSDSEPLWRKIFNSISDSQTDYPKKVDSLLPKEYIQEIRTEITFLMHKNGYTGNYPGFSKVTDLKSIRTADCHGEPFTIFNEKNAKLYIHCIEDVSVTNQLFISFVTGTALNKKGVNTTDIFSCLFYKRGKMFNNNVTWGDVDQSEKTIEQIVNIAFKKAELKKLTKEEQKLITTFKNGCTPLYLVMGVIFGGLFTLLFAIFAFFFVLFMENSQVAVDIVKTFPWWQCFIASGGLFGIAMFLISLHTQRK